MRHFTLPLFFLLCVFMLNAQNWNPYTVSTRLADRFEAAPASYQRASLLLHDQFDFPALERILQQQDANLQERAARVITELQSFAETRQSRLLSDLEDLDGVAPGTVTPYWIANVIFVTLNQQALAVLSEHPDIAHIDWNAPLFTTEVTHAAPPVVEPNGTEPGLLAINAPALWAMGYTGYGQVAYINDTGVEPDHPSLAQQFRGFYVEPEVAWFQYNSENTEPFDCDDHGTHVTGTTLGLDRLTNDTIGVAFNAQWVASPAIACETGNEDNIAALQWALDPDGDPGTIEDMPDAINNSWYDPFIEDECNSVYVGILQALETAGVAAVFSAGNEGPGEMTVTAPHNINVGLVNSFTVAAVNGNIPSWQVANFSSRGPSLCGGTGSLLIKPEVAAPGVSVRSAVRQGGYDFFSGTSMAAPHVTGAILLLKEAFPDLTGKELKEALYYTCIDLGDAGEDNTYGQGMIDVAAAYDYLVAAGNVPIDPTAQIDALLITAEAAPVACANTVAPTIVMENAGQQNLTELEIAYRVGDVADTYVWTGDLAPLERATIALPELTVDAGSWKLEVDLLQPNGTDDDRPLNNRFVRPVEVLDRPPLEAQPAGGADAVVCALTPALLRADYLGDSEVVINWYDAPVDGEWLGSGPVYETDPLLENTTFYAEALFTETLGAEADAYDDFLDWPGPPDGEGLVFDAAFPFVLKSVKVYVPEAGGRILQLRDSEGESIKTKPVSINTTGVVELALNMSIPAGEDMQLVIDLGKPFGYVETADYPYQIDDIVTIQTGLDPGGTVNPGAYYYFFDWVIEYEEPCGRTPVEVMVQDFGIAPVANFSLSDTALTLSNGEASVSGTDLSDGAASWSWNFGDGTLYSEPDPTHVYTGAGDFWVSLTVAGADGCHQTAYLPVVVAGDPVGVVDQTGSEKLNIYPNPASGTFFVDFEHPLSSKAQLRIWSSAGQLVRTEPLPGGTQTSSVEIDTLPSGLYWISVQTEDGIKTARLLIE